MRPLRFEFIPVGHRLYARAVELRHEVFFKPTGTSIECLFDAQENSSHHLLALGPDDEVAGYMRFTQLDGATSQISQLVVAPEWRGDLRVAFGFHKLMHELAERLGSERVVADVRLPGVRAFGRYGFRCAGEPFPSPKTSIMHQRMILELKASRSEG